MTRNNRRLKHERLLLLLLLPPLPSPLPLRRKDTQLQQCFLKTEAVVFKNIPQARVLLERKQQDYCKLVYGKYNFFQQLGFFFLQEGGRISQQCIPLFVYTFFFSESNVICVPSETADVFQYASNGIFFVMQHAEDSFSTETLIQPRRMSRVQNPNFIIKLQQ